jgi:hypothetical protein
MGGFGALSGLVDPAEGGGGGDSAHRGDHIGDGGPAHRSSVAYAGVGEMADDNAETADDSTADTAARAGFAK